MKNNKRLDDTLKEQKTFYAKLSILDKLLIKEVCVYFNLGDGCKNFHTFEDLRAYGYEIDLIRGLANDIADAERLRYKMGNGMETCLIQDLANYDDVPGGGFDDPEYGGVWEEDEEGKASKKYLRELIDGLASYRKGKGIKIEIKIAIAGFIDLQTLDITNRIAKVKLETQELIDGCQQDIVSPLERYNIKKAKQLKEETK